MGVSTGILHLEEVGAGLGTAVVPLMLQEVVQHPDKGLGLNFLFFRPRLTAFIEIPSLNLVFFLVFP